MFSQWAYYANNVLSSNEGVRTLFGLDYETVWSPLFVPTDVLPHLL